MEYDSKNSFPSKNDALMVTEIINHGCEELFNSFSSAI